MVKCSNLPSELWLVSRLPEESGARGIVGISLISLTEGSGNETHSGEAGVLLAAKLVSGDGGVEGISIDGDSGEPLVSGETI